MIRAVTFDVGGTLIEPWPSVGHVYAEVAAQHGWAGLSIEALNRDQSGGLQRDEVICLHGDCVGRAAQHAQSATDAASFVLDHRGACDNTEFLGLEAVQHKVVRLGMIGDFVQRC